jgi:hypothetical protein
MSSLKSSSSSSVAIKPGQHRIDSIADHAASMIMSEEETIVTPNKTKLTKKNLEALSTQDAYSVRCPKNLVCSPTNSLCSQSTALSRARTEIEGRRKSRAAARARASAALDEIQSRNKDAKEKAWAALEQIQRSRSFGSRIGSMKSSSNEEEEERRQPVSLNFNQVDETREENEDRVGQVIMVKSPSSKSKKHAEKADVNEKKVRYQENEKTSKERRKRGTRRSRDKSVQHKDSNKEKTVPTEPSTNNFVFTEEALLAVSQAALEVAVSPKSLETIASVDEKDELGGDQDENTGMDPDGIVSTDAAADLQSLASSKAKSKTSKSTSSPMLSEADVFAVSLAALDVSTQMDSFPVEDEHMIIDKYGILDDVSGMNDVSSTPFVSTASEASTQPYTKDAQRKSSSSTVVSEMSKFDQNSTAEGDRMETSVFTTEERKEIAEEPTPRVSNSSPVPPPERALSPVAVETASLSPDDVKAPTSVQNDATLKSEEESTRASSGSSSSWENENEQTDNEQQSIEKKPSEIDKEMGALDSMMFQKKGLGQLNNAKPPPAVETGLTTNSEYSGHSSYSSDDMTNDLTLNKSMGPVWQKALNDAQKTLHPKSDKKSEGMLHVDDGSVADDDTVFSAKPGFNRERLQSVGKHKSFTSSIRFFDVTPSTNSLFEQRHLECCSC